MYVIDFVDLRQYKKESPERKRKIKRDLKRHGDGVKGIAGILGMFGR